MSLTSFTLRGLGDSSGCFPFDLNFIGSPSFPTLLLLVCPVQVAIGHWALLPTLLAGSPKSL